MDKLKLLNRQPEFPLVDLSEENTDPVSYYLEFEKSDQAHAQFLKETLRVIHTTGHEALKLMGISIDYSEAEFNAFCNGFAALEYTTHLVNPRNSLARASIKRARHLLVDAPELAPLEIANSYELWQQSHPNTYGVIIEAGEKQGETMKQLHARGIGAEIAFELQGGRDSLVDILQ